MLKKVFLLVTLLLTFTLQATFAATDTRTIAEAYEDEEGHLIVRLVPEKGVQTDIFFYEADDQLHGLQQTYFDEESGTYLFKFSDPEMKEGRFLVTPGPYSFFGDSYEARLSCKQQSIDFFPVEEDELEEMQKEIQTGSLTISPISGERTPCEIFQTESF